MNAAVSLQQASYDAEAEKAVPELTNAGGDRDEFVGDAANKALRRTAGKPSIDFYAKQGMPR